MTRVMTGVKGQFEVNYAPSLLKKDPPAPSPNEIEIATSTHTQDPLVLEVLKVFRNSYVEKVYITSRGIS